MKKLIVAACAALALGACATQTPYQPASKATGGYGYTETRFEGDRWGVTFAGNSITSRRVVEQYMLFHAAELTVNKGFDWFETINRSTERQTQYVADPDPWMGPYGGWRPYWRGYRGGGWGPWGAWGPDWDVNQYNRYEASAEIIMHHGPKPADNPRAFDAHEVMANLGPHIVRPEQQK